MIAEPITVRRRYHDGGSSSWVGDLRGRCRLDTCIRDMNRYAALPHAACDLLVGMSDGTTVVIKPKRTR